MRGSTSGRGLLLGVTVVGSLAIAASAAVGQDPASEVRRLADDERVRMAFGAIETLEPRSMDDHVTLTQIPAPPFMEEERARVFTEWLRDAGADSVFIDEVGNVIAVRHGRGVGQTAAGRDQAGAGGRRTVVLGGHLDTVFPDGTDVAVQQRGDTLFAPGVSDDTRGLILVLTVLRAMEQTRLETEADVWFVGVVGEEGLGDLRGMKHLFRPEAPKIDAWIEIDGGGLDRVINKGLGSYRYRVAFRGPGGHSWGAFGLANPAHALGRAVRHFQDAADTLTRAGARTSYNVGRLGGGTSVNSIPFEAWMEVDMRSESPASLDRIDAAFRAAMAVALEEENSLRREGPLIELQLDKIGDRPSGEIPDDAPLVLRALAALELMGGDPELGRSSTDSNIPISMGVPAVTIGHGGVGGGGHSPGEWWLNQDGHLAIQAALLLLVSEAGLWVPVP